MFIINELLTTVTYTGNGTQTNFDIPFDYLRKSFVFASINNEATSDFTIDGRTLIFNEAPAEEAIIVIYRKTDTKPLVSWADASVFRSGDMTISQIQQLHIIEEGQDWSRTNSVVLEDDVYNMRFHRVTNVADPVEENDVVTKVYMESVQGGFVQQNTALKNEATKQAGIATTKAGEASASASAAKTSETNAQKWAESSDSPDGQEDYESPTGENMSAKEWALYAKQLAIAIGNPVVSVEEKNGNLEVTKSNGDKNTIDIAKLPVGYEFFTFNPTVQTGVLQYLGGEYSRETYKDLWKWVQTQPDYLISESEWQEKAAANNGNVPFYSTGDGSTTFRVPSVKCWVKGANETGEIGKYLPAGMPNIKGSFDIERMQLSRADDAFSYVERNASNYGLTNPSNAVTVSMDASKSSSVYGNADTVQPESIVGVWCVKAFGTVSNLGNQDVAELSAEVTRVGTKVNEVESKVNEKVNELENNTAVLYINGGTAEEPANVSINNRYIENNPFAGYYIQCDVQLLVEGKWGSVGNYFFANGGNGVLVSQLLPDDTIIIQTATKNLFGNGVDGANIFNVAAITSAPCRVIVHKMGKIGEA